MPPSELSTFELFIKTYGGWIGLAVFFLYAKVWPLIADKWFPTLMKNQETEYQQRLIEVREDIEFRRGIERDRAAAAKVTSDAIQQLSLAMMQTNERMMTILENQKRIQEQQLDTQKFLSDSIAAMREARAHQQGFVEGKHAPKTGPLDEKKP
jgi:hypothetical protein